MINTCPSPPGGLQEVTWRTLYVSLWPWTKSPEQGALTDLGEDLLLVGFAGPDGAPSTKRWCRSYSRGLSVGVNRPQRNRSGRALGRGSDSQEDRCNLQGAVG